MNNDKYKIYGKQFLQIKISLSYCKDMSEFDDNTKNINHFLCEKLEEQNVPLHNEESYIRFYADQDLLDNIILLLNTDEAKDVILKHINEITDFENLDIIKDSFEIDDVEVINGLVQSIIFIFKINEEFSIDNRELEKEFKPKFQFLNPENLWVNLHIFLSCKDEYFIQQEITATGDFNEDSVKPFLDFKKSNFRISFSTDRIEAKGF